ARTGRRSGSAGRRLRAGLSAPPRVAHLRHRPAPAENRPVEARLMESHAIVSLLQEALPGAQLESVPSIDLQETFYISRDHVAAAARLLHDREDLRFGLLAELTAADFYPREPRFELIYILVSIVHRRRIRMKVRLQGGDAHVATVCGIWPAANWLERE